jgi:hypothetical protein
MDKRLVILTPDSGEFMFSLRHKASGTAWAIFFHSHTGRFPPELNTLG